MKPEPEVQEIVSVWIDRNSQGLADVGDLHALIVEVDRQINKFKTSNERMRVAICSELIHKVNLGRK